LKNYISMCKNFESKTNVYCLAQTKYKVKSENKISPVNYWVQDPWERLI